MNKLILLILCLVTTVAYGKPKNLNNQTELAIIQSGGNSNTETYNLKTATDYTKNKLTYKLGGHYTLGVSETVDDQGNKKKSETTRNWDFLNRADYSLTSNKSLYSQILIEGDKFSGFNQRDNYGFGALFKHIHTDKITFESELGYRYSVERLTSKNADGKDLTYTNKARVFLKYARTPKENIKMDFWVEYLRDFSDKDDYIINFSPSLSLTMTSMFALKLSYKGTYDNAPAVKGNEYLDYQYTTSLIMNY